MNKHDEKKALDRARVVPPSEIRYEAKIRCSGKLHKVSVIGYSLVLHGHLENLTACTVAATLGGEEGTCTCLKVREAFKRAICDGEVKTKTRYSGGYKEVKVLKGIQDADRALLPKSLREAVMGLVSAVAVKRQMRRERKVSPENVHGTPENRKLRDGNMSRDRCKMALKASHHKFGRGLTVTIGGYGAPSLGHSSRSPYGYVAEINHDWIRTVALKGLANVDGHVVLGVLTEFTDGTLDVKATLDLIDTKTKTVIVGYSPALARKIDGKWTLVFPVPKEEG